MVKIITIIGSRETPPDILARMRRIAKYCARNGIVVRSGKAGGADAAAIYGCMDADFDGYITQSATPEMYIPWSGFGEGGMTNKWDINLGDSLEAEAIAKSIHPAWERCSQGAKRLHSRNVGQILGRDLNTPTDLVLYWCKEKFGKPTGGTATAVNLGTSKGCATLNMLHEGWNIKLKELIGN